ncbi:hypothetical protein METBISCDRAFT_26295 [Metschnikowia bicuspidata]|uniref:tRNA (guanine(37)-N1)-methyltransferase n=1 Tax=Metschnikowia bicuspidata TaxID=27322 RepID=A0A4P9ZG11_9ASCO|nr:hypothetical protein METBISCDRAFT_26295 [Metschnikowia bicuspidata]
MTAGNKFIPPVNRAMTVLDRAFFHKEVPLLLATFPNPRHLGDFLKVCKDEILQVSGVKHIITVNGTKGVLLRDDIYDVNTCSDKLSPVALQKIKEYEIKIEPYTLKLDYDFWKSDDILQAVLPEQHLHEYPSGFAQAGHVAHLNLKCEFQPYGKLIGQVILDKNHKVETVVNKLDTIDTEFRTFKMEILAGKDDLLVLQSESGCKFVFDFSKVYWNSRLSTEHERLVKKFLPGQVVGDVFAGVGPFAVPAGKKYVLVLANDLNPESYKYLVRNVAGNHVADFVKEYNLDGREYIRDSPSLLLKWHKTMGTIEKSKTIKRRKVDPDSKQVTIEKVTESKSVPIPKYISHYAMNLPDSALTFLNEFIGLYTRDPEVEEIASDDPDFRLPIINVHCFEKYSADEPEPSMEELHRRVHVKIETIMEMKKPFEEFEFHMVRRAAPTKPMFCVSFELPREVAFRK